MTPTKEQRDELRLSDRLRAAACGIAEGNVADPHGHRVGLLRQAADALDAAELENVGLRTSLQASTNMIDLYKAERDSLRAAQPNR